MKTEFKAYLAHCINNRLSTFSGVTLSYCTQCLALGEALEEKYKQSETVNPNEELLEMQKYIEDLQETLENIQGFIQLLNKDAGDNAQQS
jgi:hypothetical protein